MLLQLHNRASFRSSGDFHFSTLLQVRVVVFVALICAATSVTGSIAIHHGNLRYSSPQSMVAERPRDLSGYWRFALDRTDAGVKQLWFNQDLPQYIRLPGILQSQLQGDAITTSTPWVMSLYDRYWFLRDDYKDYIEKNVKVPFLSQPPRHYLGVAWYQREIEIPPHWAARRVVLTLERPHWETTVWVDGKKIGSDKSLVTSHVYDLGTITTGRHRLTIRVDNRMLLPYRPDAHSISDSVAASWNGITGKIELSSTGRVWLDYVQAFPNLPQKSMLIKVRIGNQTGRSGQGTLTAIWPDVGIVPASWDENGGSAEVEVPLRNDVPTWDEFSPKMQPLRLWLKGTGVDEYYDLRIGLRDFRVEGNQFHLNGRQIIFRGTHHGGDFPLTGYPPTDVASWKKLFETCRRWGLNHMRFHSWCPPEAAFEAADELGFYLQLEPGMWNEFNPGAPMERTLYEETDRFIKSYGNHPSFMLMSPSNEPKGKWKETLTKWVEYYRRIDPRRLYTNATGHNEREVPDLNEGADYLAIQRTGSALRRESGWWGNDYRHSLVDINLPVIAHEVGQWAAYPDFDIISKFKGYMRPGNLEIFRDSLKAHGLLENNKSFAMNSGKFQLASYKEEIEANLRTPGLSGFQLLDLHDYLGQGTSFVGLLDPFWEEKSYATADEFKQFCNTTVPLARLKQRVFTTAERFEVDVEVAHFGAEPIENGKGVWRLSVPGLEMHGEWDPRTIPIGKNIPLGKILIDLSLLKGPGEYTLTVTVAPASLFRPDGKIVAGPNAVRGVTYFENQWNFWLYPSANGELGTEGRGSPACPRSRVTDILVTDSWEEAEKVLGTGGKVLFVPRNVDLDWNNPPLDIVPVFWNRLLFPAWGRMLGLFIDRKPGESKSFALGGFPTDSHFDWQWAQIIPNVRAVNLERLPTDLEPVVWAIDDWNRNYKLGVIFECAVGDGRLLVSAFDVTRSAESNPVARQLRNSLLEYMRSDCFQPQVSVMPQQIRTIFFDTRIMRKLGAVARVGAESAGSVIDGDPNTFVLVGDPNGPGREEIDFTIAFPAPVAISGIVLMPRQNHRDREGAIRHYALRVSEDGSEWRDAARGELPSTLAPYQIEFPRTITARYLKLFSLSGYGPDKTTSLAELAVIYAGPKLNDGNRRIEYLR